MKKTSPHTDRFTNRAGRQFIETKGGTRKGHCIQWIWHLYKISNKNWLQMLKEICNEANQFHVRSDAERTCGR